MSQRNLLRVMALGFGLVVFLVLTAAYLGYQGSRSIQADARRLVKDHLLTSERGSEMEAQIEQGSEELLNNLEIVLGACFLLAVGCSGFTIWLVAHTMRRLERQSEELNQVSWHMIEDQERVARRFSHEMHDELGQMLVGLKGMVKRSVAPEFDPHRKEVTDTIIETINEVLRGVRELSQLLRPVILDDFGLDAGLRWVIERFSERTQIETHYDSNFQGRLPELMETHLFRITQEALTNVARHSGATRVSVSLNVTAAHVRLIVEDNGRGFKKVDSHRPSLGMVGMRARARHLNGVFRIEPGSSGGARVVVEAPIRWEEAGAAEELASASRT
jgi:signal transduction histidine kinase